MSCALPVESAREGLLRRAVTVAGTRETVAGTANSRVKIPDVAFEKEITMLYWAAVFFVIALLAAIFGFGGIAAGAVEVAKILFFVFLVVFAVTLILGLINRR